jgi:FkbM family methyltransferase
MNTKALVRFLYANIPGLAGMRFAAMDLSASYIHKPEYKGTAMLGIGNGLIVDVGANRGQSIAAFKRFAPASTIIAFEPDPRSAARLVTRYRSDKTVKIEHSALGDKADTLTLFVPSYGTWDCDGMAATDRETATEWLKDPGRMFRYDETKLTVREYPVVCRTLDSYELAPVLIKLHAQGAEPDILRGSRQTIRDHGPAVICAFPSSSVTQFFADLGYGPFIYRHGRFSAGIAQRPITFTWYFADRHIRSLPIDI